METFVQDVRYAIRNLMKSPRFAAAALLTLAAGIGANSAIFCLMNALFLKPIPGVEAPRRLVSVYRMQKNDEFDVLGFPDYADYRDRARSLAGLAAFCDTPMSLNEGAAERVVGSVITGNYFSLLGVHAARGRVILPEDDVRGGQHAVAVLSEGLWQRKFGADPTVVGRTIALNGFPFTVIGVAADEFNGTVTGEPVDVWVPMSMLDEAMPRTVGHHFFDERAWGWLRVVGRLKPGATFERAESEMKGIAGQLALAYPQTNAGRTVALVQGAGMDPDDKSNLARLLGLLFGGVALLLLIACANVAGLLLVRATGRQREMAMRLALGAGRARLVRQLLTEGLLLALSGGTLGILAAPWMLAWAIHWTEPSTLLHHVNAGMDARVLLFTLAVSVITGVLFALAPSLRASSPDLVEALKQGAPGSGQRRSTLQRLLAAGQVAVSFVLLMGAGLLMRSMRKILFQNPGFETRNILLGSINLTNQGYSPVRGRVFLAQLLERLRAMPGVVSASLAMTVPPQDFSGRVSIFYPGQEPPQDVLRGHEFELGLRVDLDAIAPGYFRTMGIPIFQGRDFSDRDGQGSTQRDQDGNLLGTSVDLGAPGVVIVNHQLAQRLWPGKSAVGKRISWPTLVGPPRAPLEVVGVAADSKYRSLVAGAPLLMYVPIFQNYDGRPTIVLRTATDPQNFSAPLRQTIAALDKNLPVFGIKTMTEQMEFSIWQQRMAASLVSVFAALAVLLAAVGLYGVVAHSVALRTREMGVRMALGAQPRDVLRLVVGEGLKLMLAGLAMGMATALALARLVEAMLFDVRSTDAITWAAVSLLLAAVTLGAAYLPAHRATRVDPVVALRYE